MLAARIISESKYRLFYIKAIASDKKPAWYFVAINAAKYQAFKKLDAKAGYNISDYGNILESGYGESAPSEVIEAINKKYNCDFSN